MNRIHRRIAVLACAGLLAPLALSSATSAAIDQDLVVSATSGAPGDTVTVSSASCPPAEEDTGEERFLRVLLISGTGTDAVLAGLGSGYGEATFVVPDWVDPADPAVIEASCVTFDFWSEGDETSEAYDPVAFDVLPGAGSPTQGTTLSRDELLVGQAFEVSGTGCDGQYAGVDLSAGGDLSGRSLGDSVAFGEADVDGGSFTARIDLIERFWSVGWSVDGGRPRDIEFEAGRTEIAPGSYTAFTYCGSYDEATDTSTFVVLPPHLVEVAGTAPIDEVDLDVPAGTREGTLTGLSCTAGDVTGTIRGIDLVALDDEFEDLDELRSAPAGIPSPIRPGADRRSGSDTNARALAHEETSAFAVTPSEDGTWSTVESATFDGGVLIGEATCGDPLGDGFSYDLAGGVVEVAETPVTVPPTAPPSTVPATGAAPVTGTPTYAG